MIQNRVKLRREQRPWGTVRASRASPGGPPELGGRPDSLETVNDGATCKEGSGQVRGRERAGGKAPGTEPAAQEAGRAGGPGIGGLAWHGGRC